MPKERIRSSTISGEPVLPGSEELDRIEASPAWSVIVSDHQPARLQKVCRGISECGAVPRPFSEPLDLQGLRATDNCTLAVVALESRPASGHSSVEAIRALKQNGFKILAYEDGLRNWSLTERCVPLLAGATQLVDSTNERFPVELQVLLIRLRRLETERTAEERQVRRVMSNLGMIGESQPMLALFRTVLRVSVLSDLPTLLTGETGTGKECLARAVHHLDPKRRAGPFIALNCGALTPTLAESELFGHRRGAFTGAERERKGLIRAAHGGVLFLDEIGELSEPLQAKLLRVLQENHVLAVGDEHEVAVSVRVVAATNRNLIEMVEQGSFRADLFHRLNVLSVNVPALRERPADVLPLIQFFLSKHRLLKPTGNLAADEEFVEAIKQADLPGNVRQLESLICQALVKKETDTPLDLSDLPIEILRQLSAETERAAHTPGTQTTQTEVSENTAPLSPRIDDSGRWAELLDFNSGSLARSLKCCERELLAEALRRTDGNQTQTARLLGLTPRSVYNKVRKHHLRP